MLWLQILLAVQIHWEGLPSHREQQSGWCNSATQVTNTTCREPLRCLDLTFLSEPPPDGRDYQQGEADEQWLCLRCWSKDSVFHHSKHSQKVFAALETSVSPASFSIWTRVSSVGAPSRSFSVSRLPQAFSSLEALKEEKQSHAACQVQKSSKKLDVMMSNKTSKH